MWNCHVRLLGEPLEEKERIGAGMKGERAAFNPCFLLLSMDDEDVVASKEFTRVPNLETEVSRISQGSPINCPRGAKG
jgi:hypothetical protein